MQLLNVEFILLIISIFFEIFLIYNLLKKKPLTQIQIAYTFVFACVLIMCSGVAVQYIFNIYTNINPIYFENYIYIGTCFLPVALFFAAIIFKNQKMKFKRYYLLLFIVPILSLMILFTNSKHHLFYENYSSNLNEMVFGNYFYIHTIYTYLLFFISICIILKASNKRFGLFSKQMIVMLIGTLIPLLTNLLGTLKIFDMSVCMTPISFAITVILYDIAIFRLNILNIAPIALRKVVDQISDSYIVLDENDIITDFNQTFINTFKLKPENIKNKNIYTFFKEHKEYKVNTSKIEKTILKTQNTNKTVSFEQKFEKLNRYFTVEISVISSENTVLGTLILLKDITQHKQDMETITNNQNALMERERLASLGQMVGGIAHNLKTPIMSIAGATEGLRDLIAEYENSITDPEVTIEDHHAIAHDMIEWIDKINSYDAYMSDIITAVKGQAVNMNDDSVSYFSIEELLNRVNILMKHELKHTYTTLNIVLRINKSTKISGNINSLVQVLNNLISNAIQSYDVGNENTTKISTSSSKFVEKQKEILKKENLPSDLDPAKKIDLILEEKNDNIIISVKDYGCGIPEKVQKKLFNEMITTKGHNGTGLGLFMSYSTIKGHFNGDITFTSKVNVGTTFKIILPKS